MKKKKQKVIIVYKSNILYIIHNMVHDILYILYNLNIYKID